MWLLNWGKPKYLDGLAHLAGFLKFSADHTGGQIRR